MYLRRALREREYSKKLNIWIDMMFGSKQQNKKKLNIFFDLASKIFYLPSLAPKYYENANKSKSQIERENLKSVAQYFQLPTKLFNSSHITIPQWKFKNIKPEMEQGRNKAINESISTNYLEK